MQTSYPPADTPRERLLRVRVTDQEHESASRRAARQGRSLSEFVRVKLAEEADLPHLTRDNPFFGRGE